MVGFTDGNITQIYYELDYVLQISYVEALTPMTCITDRDC